MCKRLGFGVKLQVYEKKKSFGTIFRSHRLSCGPRTGRRGCRRSRTTTYKGWNWNLGTEHATDLVLVSNPMRPFSWCSMMLRSTWRSRTGCTGCRRSRATLRCKISLLWCQLCPHIFKHLKLCRISSMTLRSTWMARTWWWGCRRPRMTSWIPGLK